MTSEVAVARWTAGGLARIAGGNLVGAESTGFDAVTTDSRESRPGAAFFALDGPRSRGLTFAAAAFGAGCSVVVVPPEWSGDVPEGAAALVHPDPLSALAGLAASVRQEWACPVLCITGSAGKTTVKEMTAHVLAEDLAVLRSPGNFNTVEGLSRTLLGAAGAPDVAVLEVGASLPGEIARLAGIARPTSACVTNVGAAHLKGFGGVEDIRREKVSLLHAVAPGGMRIVDGDDPALISAAGAPAVRVGFGAGNDLRAVNVEEGPERTRFRLEEGGEGDLPLPGEHNVKNALFALAFAAAHGVPAERALERLRDFAGVSGRMEILLLNGVHVVDDSYNANPESVRAALRWFTGYRAQGRRAVCLGDMRELGTRSEELHTAIGGAVTELAPELAVFVGAEMRAAFEEAKRRSHPNETLRHVADSLEAARLLAGWARPGDAILVKGSRGVRMERVVQALREGEAPRAV